MPEVPQSCDEMIQMIVDEHGPLPDTFDGGRIAPRAHELALWNQTAATKAMKELLMRGQHSLSFDKIVALSQELADGPARKKPLQVRCLACGKQRNFDFLFGAFNRMAMSSNRESKYVAWVSNEEQGGYYELKLVMKVKPRE